VTYISIVSQEVAGVDLPECLTGSSFLAFSSRNGEKVVNRFLFFFPYVAMAVIIGEFDGTRWSHND